MRQGPARPLLYCVAAAALAAMSWAVSAADAPPAPDQTAETATAPAPAMLTPALPTDPQLDCRDIPPQLPHVVLVAKTKAGEKYGEVPFGCVQFTEEEKLAENQVQALDAAAAYLLQLKNVIRVYLDLSIPAYAAKDAQKRYREQAFAVKNYLTGKGVFTHLQDVRKTHYPPPSTQAEAGKAPTTEKKPKQAPQPTAAPKRANPSAEYAYHVNKPDLHFPGDNPTLFQQAEPGPFQFVPLETVYFVHDKDQLTDRAQAVLDSIAEYVMRTGEGTRLLLQGHADETGSAAYNYRLTDRRALTVRDYLVERGVPAADIELLSRGEVSPVDENWARQGRARNRRVELYLVQRGAPAKPVVSVPAAGP